MSGRPTTPTVVSALDGSLRFFSPLDVIQWLVPHPGEGVLLLEADAPGPPSVWLHCRAGEAVAVRVQGSSGTPLGMRLIREGRIDEARLRYALGLQALCAPAERRPLGEILRAHRWIGPDDLRGALDRLAREGLRNALGWRRGRFAYRPGRLAPPAIPLGVRLDRLLLEIARDLDEAAAER